MNVEEFREYCLNKKGVTEEFPFDEVTIVFKVKGKMFAAAGIDNFFRFNVKCDPEIAIELREEYEAVTSGYHMSKKHWNSIYLGKDMDTKTMFNWIDHSYNMVVKSLTKKLQKELNE